MVAPKRKIMGRGESSVTGIRGAVSSARANARGLKAANKPTRASKNPEIKMTQNLAKSNRSMGQTEPNATRNAARQVDKMRKLKNSK